MAQPLLNGEVDSRDFDLWQLRQTVEKLQVEVTRLDAENHDLKRELTNLRGASANLRRVLGPLHRAVNMIFGELDEIGEGQETGSTAGNPSKWDAVKQRLQPRHREVIDLLLIQGSMGRKQIAAALKMDYANCAKNVIGVLLRQGWLVDNGREGVSLKQL